MRSGKTRLAVLALGFSAPLLAQPEPALTFPLIASGSQSRTEIALTNPGANREEGVIQFWTSDGQPMPLSFSGIRSSSHPFQVPPGGILRLVSDGFGELQVGYATVSTARPSSSLTGTAIYDLQGARVSVPASQLSHQNHVYIQRGLSANSGLALANPSDTKVKVVITLFDQEGNVRREEEFDLGPRGHLSKLLDELFSRIGSEFSGTAQAIASRPIALLGLRVRSQGQQLSIATLAGSPSAFERTVSQLLFTADAGVNLRGMGFSDAQLQSQTVRELTGVGKATRSSMIHVANTNPEHSTTVHVRYFNDRCRQVLEFLALIPCAEEYSFDPFDAAVPVAGRNLSRRFFGEGAAGDYPDAPMTAAEFGSGRFLVSVTAVGASRFSDDQADILFPFEQAPAGSCGVAAESTGGTPGFSSDNLHSCNARPMSFNYLSGAQSADRQGLCRGSAIQLEDLTDQSGFTRLLTEEVGDGGSPCLSNPILPADACTVLSSLEALGSSQCIDGPVGATLKVRFAQEAFQLLPS